MVLSKEQIARYSRQLILPEIGVAGQQRLLGSSVLIIGAGGLGSPAALYLAAAGVGHLGLMDHETVALSNLHRQVLYATSDVGRPKAHTAEGRLAALNPEVRVSAMQERLGAANARQVIEPYDLVLDGSDNFPTRYLANDACVLLGKPLISGGVIHMRGQLLTVFPARSACFRCVFPEPPTPGAIPSCQEAGVVGPAVGVIGSLMAHEALKVLLGIGEPLCDRLLVFDGTSSRVREIPVRRNPTCAVCGDSPTMRELVAEDEPLCPSVEGQQEGAWRGSRSR